MADHPPKKINWNIELGGISRRDILLLTRHLAAALKHGLPLPDSLDMLQAEIANQKFKTLLNEILEMIRAGKPLYAALEKYPKHFSAVYTNLVKTGEMAGTLGESLDYMARELKKSEELRAKVKSALMYPLLIFVAVVGLGASVAVFILPKILPLFKTLDVPLPFTTRLLIGLTDLFSNYGVRMILIFVGFLVFFFWIIRQPFIKPYTHRFLLRLPVIGAIIKNIQLERFNRILFTLLKSSITLDKALRITADATTNWVYRQAIASFITQVEKGVTLGAAMAFYPRLFPPLNTRMMAMGERTGSLEDSLEYLGQAYAEEIDNTMKNLSTILEPVMLILIGLVVGVVAISILGPIYKITGSLRQ